jgi:ketosteroid isomerase-like protein
VTRSIHRVAALVGALAVSTFAHSESPAASRAEAEHVLQLQEERLTDALASRDIKQLERLWADDFVSTMTDGRATTRDQRFVALRAEKPGGTPAMTAKNERIEVRAYGEWAVVLVTSVWQIGGKTVGNPYQATHVWARQKGEWRLVAAHISQLQCPSTAESPESHNGCPISIGSSSR